MDSEFFKQMIDLVEKRLGLKHHAILLSSWKEFLKERMLKLDLLDYEDYWNYLQQSPMEWQELVELVIIPETWFFRDQTVFDFLAFLVKHSQLSPSFIKILSLACSSGEEPYSIAMALLNAGMPQDAFIVDAVDISHVALKKAQRGVYQSNAFRHKHSIFRDRYFTKTNSEYEIVDQIKGRVNFYHGNLLNQKIPLYPHSYSLIFCRNLLIYLNRESQQDLLNQIKILLIPKGFLIVGSAETHLVHRTGFTPIKTPNTYTFMLKS